MKGTYQNPPTPKSLLYQLWTFKTSISASIEPVRIPTTLPISIIHPVTVNLTVTQTLRPDLHPLLNKGHTILRSMYVKILRSYQDWDHRESEQAKHCMKKTKTKRTDTSKPQTIL